MQYAIIESGGKQYRVSEGDVLEVDALLGEAGNSLVLEKVLLRVSDKDVVMGNPYIPNLVVKTKILQQKKGEKIRVAKFKSKVRYRRVTGFRAHLTRLQIEQIGSGMSAQKATTEKSVKEVPIRKETARKQSGKKAA